MVFKLEDYTEDKGKFVIGFKTKEESDEIRNYLHENGRRWHNGSSYLDAKFDMVYCMQGEDDLGCYDFNAGKWQMRKYYENEGYTILNWSDFEKIKQFTKSDLEVGMVVEVRNGNKYLVCHGGRIVRETCWSKLACYDEQLLSSIDEHLDIVKIYKKIDVSNLSDILDVSDEDLVWERNKRKETKQFTEDELLFLKKFTDGYNWIAKDRGGEVYIYKKKPCRNTNNWLLFAFDSAVLPNTLPFDCLSWGEEPTRIDDCVDRTK